MTSVSCAVVAIFGIEDSKFGCSCEEHRICGANVDYDTVFRLKTMVVTSGKNKVTTIMAAVWITDGMDRCILGYVDPRAMEVRERLEGRMGQVTELFSLSESKTKNRYSAAHKGVCLAALVENYLSGDECINSYLDLVEDSDQSAGEEEA